MKTLAALGIAGGFLFGAPRWLVLLMVLRTTSRLSTGLSVAILKEVLKAGIVR
jgi:hypothetical protein